MLVMYGILTLYMYFFALCESTQFAAITRKVYVRLIDFYTVGCVVTLGFIEYAVELRYC